MDATQLILSGLGAAVALGVTFILNGINKRLEEQRASVIKIFETLATLREALARTEERVDRILAESRVELQLGRIVSDMESEKRTRAVANQELLRHIDNLKKPGR